MNFSWHSNGTEQLEQNSRRILLLTSFWSLVSSCMLRRPTREKQSSLSPEQVQPESYLPQLSDQKINSSTTDKRTLPIRSEEGPQIDPSTLIFSQGRGLCFVAPNRVDLASYDHVSEIYYARIKMYGLHNSALIAIDFPRYQHRSMSEVYLCTASGLLLARRQVSKNRDELEDETLKPIYFDHVAIGRETSFALLIKEQASKFKKFIFPERTKFEHYFNGKKAYGLTPSSIPTMQYRNYFVDSHFTPKSGQYGYKKDPEEIIDADTSTLYQPRSLPSQSIVTDLMGNTITDTPGSYEKLSVYSALIVYQPSNEGFYYRTIVKIT